MPGINAGRLGVELFFCLSGRLMAEMLFVRQPELDRFFFRRLSRVWPALYVFTFLVFFVFSGPGELHVSGPDLLSGLTFTSNYWGIFGHRSPVLDHLWSLSVEEWSYCVLAICAICFWKGGIKPVFSLGAITLFCTVNGLVSTVLGGDYYSVYWRTDVRMSSIFIPALVFLHIKDVSTPKYLPVAAGFFGLLASVNHVPDPIKYTLGTFAFSLAVAKIGETYAFVSGVLSSAILRQIGLWSFSIYLWQQPFAKVEGNTAVRICAVFLVSYASFNLIEKPCRAWLNRIFDEWRRRRATLGRAQA